MSNELPRWRVLLSSVLMGAALWVQPVHAAGSGLLQKLLPGTPAAAQASQEEAAASPAADSPDDRAAAQEGAAAPVADAPPPGKADQQAGTAAEGQAGPGAAASGAGAAGEAQASAAPVAGDEAWRTGVQRVGALELSLVADATQVAPGDTFRVGLRLRHDPHWHTYWRNPGDTGFPTRFELLGPEGARYSDIVWPAPARLAIGPLANYGYEDETLIYRDVTLPADFRGRQARFRVKAEWLICREVCIPGEAPLQLDIPVGGATVMDEGEAASFDESRRQAPDAGKAPLRAGWWQRGNEAILLLPRSLTAESPPRQALFLPYFAEVVKPVAPQKLVEIANEEGRYGLVLSVDEQAARSAEAGWERQGGIIVMPGRQPVAVNLQRQTVVPLAGRTLALDKPVEVELEGAGAGADTGSSGLLSQFQGTPGQTAGVDGPTPATGDGAGAAAGANGMPASTDGAPGASIDIKSLGLAMLAALAGGLILNLMPCVFPVIGLKILSFTEAAAGKPAVARRHAMAFGLGVVLTFVALAALLIGLRALGQAAGWGFQLQSPVFVAAMALLFVLIGLNLFGVFEAGASLTQLGGAGQPARSGYGSSFMTGVMAVVVATPCTAPFMGSAVGFTLGSSPVQMLLVFAALGVGMALPYLVLASSQRMLAWLPRPGAWLQTFKQFLAFPMFITAAWLAWVLALQTDAEGVLLLLLAAICLGFSCWVYGRWQFELRPRGARSTPAWMVAALASLLVCIGLVSRLPVVAEASESRAAVSAAGAAAAPACVKGPDGRLPPACVGWQPWSAERLAAARAAGQPVFVNFTAAWCLTCQVNKRAVLAREEVQKAFRDRNVLLLEADWTRRDAQISAELARHGRNSVPFYLFYDGRKAEPRQLPELLTVDIVRAALAGKG